MADVTGLWRHGEAKTATGAKKQARVVAFILDGGGEKRM